MPRARFRRPRASTTAPARHPPSRSRPVAASSRRPRATWASTLLSVLPLSRSVAVSYRRKRQRQFRDQRPPSTQPPVGSLSKRIRFELCRGGDGPCRTHRSDRIELPRAWSTPDRPDFHRLDTLPTTRRQVDASALQVELSGLLPSHTEVTWRLRGLRMMLPASARGRHQLQACNEAERKNSTSACATRESPDRPPTRQLRRSDIAASYCESRTPPAHETEWITHARPVRTIPWGKRPDEKRLNVPAPSTQGTFRRRRPQSVQREYLTSARRRSVSSPPAVATACRSRRTVLGTADYRPHTAVDSKIEMLRHRRIGDSRWASTTRPARSTGLAYRYWLHLLARPPLPLRG